MAASSSATAAQSLLNCSISDPSPAHQDKLAVALGRQQRGLRVPELRLGLRRSQQRRSSSSSVVREEAVETVEEKVEAAVVEKSVNTIRFLAIGAVEKANSGHPGLPMGTPSCISLDMTVSRKKT